MWLPKPLYEIYPYLYVLTGVLVGFIWRYSPFTRIGAIALVLGAGYIIFLRFMHRRDMRLRSNKPATMMPNQDSTPIV
ncbi:MAG: hypothetical protein ACI8P9_000580 [Parasphingorhabdus sp.]|jgi:hypothetical protein